MIYDYKCLLRYTTFVRSYYNELVEVYSKLSRLHNNNIIN